MVASGFLMLFIFAASFYRRARRVRCFSVCSDLLMNPAGDPWWRSPARSGRQRRSRVWQSANACYAEKKWNRGAIAQSS